MKDETGGISIEEFIREKPKIYQFLVASNSELKKAKDVNKNDVATITHNKYKHVFLNKKCLRNSKNRIQGKDHKTILFKSIIFHSLALMTKYISKTMDMMD